MSKKNKNTSDFIAQFKVCNQACDQCLFTSDRIVPEERAKQIIQDCLKRDTFFECHKGTMRGEHICCRGFWNQHKRDVWPLRLAQIYQHLIQFVNPEGD